MDRHSGNRVANYAKPLTRRALPVLASNRSCIVVGAGLAGLAAARSLALAGWSVDVLEATTRCGGRVISHTFRKAPGLSCELGGEWIGRDHHEMLGLLRVLGLKKQRHRFGFTFWDGGPDRAGPTFRAGAWPFSSVSERKFASLGATLMRYDPCRKRELDQLDWWTWLKRNGFNEGDLLRRDLMDSTDFGESIRMTSAYAAATEYFLGDRTDEMDWKVEGGNSRLIDALADDIRRLGGRIHLGAMVTAVRQVGHEVRVSVAGWPKPLRSGHCIAAIPAPSLAQIEWSPRLPGDQTRAAAELQYARIVKTVVLYRERFWKPIGGDGFSVFTGRVSDFCFDATFGQGDPDSHAILCSYAIGDKADDVACEHEKAVMDWITQDMMDLVRPKPAHRHKGLDTVRARWPRDPFTGGAYALYRPGQWFTVRPILGRPHGRVHFAGEHLGDWQGFMEGAVDTGLAAAAAL